MRALANDERFSGPERGWSVVERKRISRFKSRSVPIHSQSHHRNIRSNHGKLVIFWFARRFMLFYAFGSVPAARGQSVNVNVAHIRQHLRSISFFLFFFVGTVNSMDVCKHAWIGWVMEKWTYEKHGNKRCNLHFVYISAIDLLIHCAVWRGVCLVEFDVACHMADFIPALRGYIIEFSFNILGL